MSEPGDHRGRKGEGGEQREARATDQAGFRAAEVHRPVVERIRHPKGKDTEWRVRNRRMRARATRAFIRAVLAVEAVALVSMLASGPVPVVPTGELVSRGFWSTVLVAGLVAGGLAPAMGPLLQAVRWARQGDYKYAAAAVAVLGVLAAGLLIRL